MHRQTKFWYIEGISAKDVLLGLQKLSKRYRKKKVTIMIVSPWGRGPTLQARSRGGARAPLPGA